MARFFSYATRSSPCARAEGSERSHAQRGACRLRRAPRATCGISTRAASALFGAAWRLARRSAGRATREKARRGAAREGRERLGPEPRGTTRPALLERLRFRTWRWQGRRGVGAAPLRSDPGGAGCRALIVLHGGNARPSLSPPVSGAARRPRRMPRVCAARGAPHSAAERHGLARPRFSLVSLGFGTARRLYARRHAAPGRLCGAAPYPSSPPHQHTCVGAGAAPQTPRALPLYCATSSAASASPATRTRR